MKRSTVGEMIPQTMVFGVSDEKEIHGIAFKDKRMCHPPKHSVLDRHTSQSGLISGMPAAKRVAEDSQCYCGWERNRHRYKNNKASGDS